MEQKDARGLYRLETDSFGISKTPVPFLDSVSANSAGVRDAVGSQTPQTNPGPVSPSSNLVSNSSVGFESGVGWYMGYDQGTPKFYVGNYPTNYISWDGETFSIFGTFVLGNSITLQPGDDIQAAIDTLEPTGGIVYLQAGTFTQSSDIVIPSGITISGAGIQSTIINFTGSFQIIADWDTITELQGISLSNFTVQGSTDTAAIYFRGVQTFNLSNILATGNSNSGILIAGCELFMVDNVIADTNGGAGFLITDSSHSSQTFSFNNCSAIDNTLAGFTFLESSGNISDFTMVRCQAISNSLAGFFFGSGNTAFEANISGCLAESNGVAGFYIDATDCSFVGCQSDSNTTYGFEVKQPLNKFVNCSGSSNTTADLYTEDGGTFVGNLFLTTSIEVSGANPTQMVANMYQQPSTYRKEYTMTNTSGGTLTEGSVVVYAATASGDDFTTTTSAGDNQVLGIVNGASILNTADGQILVEGFTDALKVNGTVDIAVGDWLACHTSAGIAAKASAGQMAFARALEAYTGNDDNGVINALLVSPRLI